MYDVHVSRFIGLWCVLLRVCVNRLITVSLSQCIIFCCILFKRERRGGGGGGKLGNYFSNLVLMI